jgi:glycosyltransferase involved in cell wall biosynthesis
LPTLTYENSPTIVFEALAAGCPVLVSQIGGAAEAISEGENGWPMPPTDPAAQLATLQQILSVNNWSPLSNNARASVAGLDAATYVRRLIGLLEQNDRRRP